VQPHRPVLRTQNAADRRGGADLIYFVFDLLHLDGRNLMPLPLADSKAGLAALLAHMEDASRRLMLGRRQHT
jgi:ATP-dependent DNA ligase